MTPPNLHKRNSVVEEEQETGLRKWRKPKEREIFQLKSLSRIAATLARRKLVNMELRANAGGAVPLWPAVSSGE